MADPFSSLFVRRTLIAGAAAAALCLGFATAPVLFSRVANAQEITPSAVAPPNGAPASFADLIERVRPAVVSISVRQRPDAAAGPPIEGLPPGYEDFFRGRPGRPGPAPTALGSGFFVDQSGVVVTNHHVVQGAEEITIRTSDGRDHPADIVGSDENTDLAVLRVRGGGRFQFVSFADASHVRVGDWVVAVGNPFGLDGTATAGIVSAIGRRDAGSNYVDFLQIDAPINRGNSGGPTFDLAGNVVGVNSQILSPTGGSVGIGFAIPSGTADSIVQQLLREGRITRGWIGVSIQALDDDIARSLGLEEAQGALVGSLVADGPAARAGIQQGDVILTYNGQRIEDSRDLTRRVGDTGVGQSARVEVLRNGQRRTLTLRLGERPSEQTLASANQPPTPPPNNPGAQQGGGVAQAALGLSTRAIAGDDRTRFGLTANETGLVITNLEPSSGLAEDGVLPGDIILQAGGRAVRTPADLNTAVEAARRANRPLLLQLVGRGGRRFVAADLAAN
jgi:serine protease Do